MPKLRHIAVTVPDLEEAAGFYEKTFGMTRATESEIAILLTDGVVSLAILKFKTEEQAGDERVGVVRATGVCGGGVRVARRARALLALVRVREAGGGGGGRASAHERLRVLARR